MRRNKKKLSIIVFSLFIIQFSILNSQDTWARSYAPWGDSQFDSYFVDDVVACQDGGFALNGTHIWYDGSNFEMNPYMIKTDSEGNVEWAERDTFLPFDTCSHTLLELDDGSFIESGHGTPPSDPYILKRDTNGDTLWTMPYQGFTIESMQETDDGNLILGGSNDYPAIRKITPEGVTLWTQDFLLGPEGTTMDHSGSITSIEITSDNDLISTGSVMGIDLFNSDFYVLKTDSEGDSLWTYKFYGSGEWGTNGGFCIISLANGSYLVDGIIDYDNQWLLAEISPTGDCEWEIRYPDQNVLYSLLETIDLNILLYGQTVIKMNNDQEIIWENNLPGNFSGVLWEAFYDGERSIKKIEDGYICVRIIDGVIGLIKMNLEGEVVAANDITIPKPVNSITCYPNPFNPSTTISFNASRENAENTVDISIEIYNVKGRKIKKLETINIISGINEIVWDGTDESNNPVTSGVYLISLKTNDDVVATKALLLK